jgi:Tfp pilus assembly protein PilP
MKLKSTFVLLLVIVFSNEAFCVDLPKSSPVETILTEDAIRTMRDPFQEPTEIQVKKVSIKSELEGFPLKDIVVNGVISNDKKSKAMITLPNTKTFFITTGSKLGKREGHVVSIVGDKINVVEYDYSESGKRIPKMYQLSVSGEEDLPVKKEEQ